MYVLCGKVIEARKIHHKNFYPLQVDYGHQSYIDTLVNGRHVALRALERVGRRTAEVLYQQEKWFRWEKDTQDAEEANREKEQKKVKQDAAMFRRHWNKLQTRLRNQQEKEEKQRQDAYLESVYQERLKSMASDEVHDVDMEGWDPIEYAIDDQHGRYIDLIKHFLWLEIEDETERTGDHSAKNVSDVLETAASDAQAPSKSKKKKGKGKTQTTETGSSPQITGIDRIVAMPAKQQGPRKTAEPNKSNIETQDELRARLRKGTKRDWSRIEGPVMMEPSRIRLRPFASRLL